MESGAKTKTVIITKIIGEMKSNFNKPEEDDDDYEDESEKLLKHIKEEETKPNLSEELSENPVRKRSSRRRKTKDSVLRSAILRKERSYNEPQPLERARRRLRLTRKILENLESNATVFRRSSRAVKAEKVEVGKPQPRSNSKGCLCTETSSIYLPPNEKDFFCQAIDGVNEKHLGCNNLINIESTPFSRPSFRVPFGLLCEMHTNRMLRHNRCPICGIFCTQGYFVECANGHHYHRKCLSRVLDDGPESGSCPHCGVPTPRRDALLSMTARKKPVFLRDQKKLSPSAKMGFPRHAAARTASALVVFDAADFDLPASSNGFVDPRGLRDIIEAGDHDRLAVALSSKGFDPGVLQVKEGEGGETAFHFCARNGHLTALHVFRSVTADIDSFDDNQNTPLTVAIVAFNNEIVKYLIESGCSINIKGTDGMNPLHISAQHGNLESCELLVEAASGRRVRGLGYPTRTEYVNACDDGGWTALAWACEYDRADVVDYLLSKGADPLVRDLKQNVALHWASCSGSEECLRHLLDYYRSRDDLNCVNVQGDTALHIAARENRYEAVLLLLLRGADPTIANNLSETPLDVCSGPDSECYKTVALNQKLLALVDTKKSKSVVLSNDISNGRESNPIQCVNFVDDDNETLPSDFVYVTDYCFTSDVAVDAKITSLRSCDCRDNCDVECECLRGRGRHYDERRRLIGNFDFHDPPTIFECNSLCACNVLTCTNRVVQNGPKGRFQLFKTAGAKGWGVRTPTSIDRGRFVCEYLGEIVTDLEADRRSDDGYLFDLDGRESESDTYCIDARRFGNLARFFNHSCDANLTPVKVFTNRQDANFPRIALFANRNIPPREELCFDYGIKYWVIKSKQFSCECRSENCKYSSETKIEEVKTEKTSTVDW